MKKIMILGAGIYQVPLIKTAKKLGLYTIVVSIPGNYPGFELADKVYYENTVDDEKILEKEKELFNEYIAGFGLTEDTFLMWQTNTAIQKKVNDYLLKDITVSDSEVDDYITKLTAEAKQAYEKSASSYAADSEYKKVWIPKDARYIKYIAVGIASSDYAEINAARNESGADDAEIDKKRDEKLAEIKEKADAALKKATAEGADFDAVVKEYSSAYSESTKGEQILVLNSKGLISDALYDAVFALEKPGDISGLIPTDSGYYIVKYVSDAKVTDSDLSDYRKTVRQELLAARQSEKPNAILDYEKLNITKEEKTSSDASASSADSKADNETSSAASSGTTTSE